jgi:hypothetical protein
MDSWQLELEDKKPEEKYNISDKTLLTDIGELINESDDYVLGYEVAFHINQNIPDSNSTIIVDYSKIVKQADFIRGFKSILNGRIIEIGRDIEVTATTINITDYPNLYKDRSFKLDIIKLVAGHKVSAIYGFADVDYQFDAPRVINVNPSQYLDWPILNNPLLIYSISGIVILIGKPEKERFFYNYRLTDQLSLIQQKQQSDPDERCRVWFVTYTDCF